MPSTSNKHNIDVSLPAMLTACLHEKRKWPEVAGSVVCLSGRFPLDRSRATSRSKTTEAVVSSLGRNSLEMWIFENKKIFLK